MLFILSGDYHDNWQVNVHKGSQGEGPESVPAPSPAPPPESLRNDKGQIMSAVEPEE